MGNRFWLCVGLLAGIAFVGVIPRTAMVYFRLGRYRDSPGRIDAFRLWRETQYVIRGRNPYDVAFAHLPAIARTTNPSDPRPDARSTAIFPDLGWPEGVDYPPWAFVSFMPFFWPGEAHYLLYYGVWMLLGIAATAAWAGAEVSGASGRWVPAVVVMMCVLAFASWGGALVVGNNPPIVIAFLVATYVLMRRGRHVLAGVALAIAMLKPTLAAPFLVPLAIHRRWRTLVAAGAVLLVESAGTWSLTLTNPLDVLRQMIVMSRFYISGGFGPAQYLMHAGVSPSLASAITATTVLAMGTAALWAVRDLSLLAQFAIAAVMARLWAYHYDYDDAVLVFALTFFAAAAASTRSRVAVTMFLLLAASLWTPGYLATPSLVVQLLEQWIWVAAAVLIVLNLASPPQETAA